MRPGTSHREWEPQSPGTSLLTYENNVEYICQWHFINVFMTFLVEAILREAEQQEWHEPGVVG